MIWIIGKVSADFRNYMESRGLSYGVFHDAQLPVPANPYGKIVPLNYTHPESIPSQLAEYPELKVNAVMVTGYENYVVPLAIIGAHYGLPTITTEAAQSATNKISMRQKFTEFDPSITPDFTAVESWGDIVQFVQLHELPVMLKPASLMKSLLITKNKSLDELRQNYDELVSAIPELYKRYSVSGPPQIIIEECLIGSMHTVAGYADATGQVTLLPSIVDCVTAGDAGFNDSFIYSRQLPSRLSSIQQQQLLDCAVKGIQALRLTNTPAHVELFLTDTGPKIIEIGARTGGYRARMYRLANGIDLQQADMQVALGIPIDISPRTSTTCAVVELFPRQRGSYRAIPSFQAMQSLRSIVYAGVKAVEGDTIGLASQGYKATAVVILLHEDPLQVQKDYEFVLEHGDVQVTNEH